MKIAVSVIHGKLVLCRFHCQLLWSKLRNLKGKQISILQWQEGLLQMQPQIRQQKNIIHVINRNCNQRSGVSSFASLDMPLLFWGTLVNKKGQHFLIDRRWVGSIEKAWRLDSDPSCLCFAQYFSSGSLTNFFATIKVAKLLWRQVMSQLKNLTGLVTNSILSSGYSIKVCASWYESVLGSRTLVQQTW